MGKYITPVDVWNFLNSYTEIRAETAGTATGNSQTFSLANKNIISGSTTIYTNGTQITQSATWDYDAGKFTLTAVSGSSVTVDYDYASIPNSVMTDFITQTEDKLDNLSRRKFNITTGRTEYLDVDENQKTFFTKYYPIQTASISRNKNHETDTPNWETLTEGLGGHYLMTDEDKLIGRFRLIDKFPEKGKNKIRVIYSYGYSSGSIPAVVKELATLECARKVLDSSIYNAYVDGREGFSPARIEQIDNRIEELRKILKRDEISLI